MKICGDKVPPIIYIALFSTLVGVGLAFLILFSFTSVPFWWLLVVGISQFLSILLVGYFMGDFTGPKGMPCECTPPTLSSDFFDLASIDWSKIYACGNNTCSTTTSCDTCEAIPNTDALYSDMNNSDLWSLLLNLCQTAQVAEAATNPPPQSQLPAQPLPPQPAFNFCNMFTQQPLPTVSAPSNCESAAPTPSQPLPQVSPPTTLTTTIMYPSMMPVVMPTTPPPTVQPIALQNQGAFNFCTIATAAPTTTTQPQSSAPPVFNFSNFF